MIAVVILVVCYLLCYVLLKRYRWEPATLAHLLRSRGLTVLPYTPLFGNLLEIGRLQRAAYACSLPSASDHCYLPRIWAFHFANCSSSSGKSAVFWLSQRASLNVVDADFAKDILSSGVKSFTKFPTAYIAVKRVLGRSLLTTDGEDWECRRRILNPAFSSDRLKAMGAGMSACVMEMINSWTQQAQRSTGEFELDVFKELSKVSADILSRTSFGSHYEEGKAVFEDQEVLIEATFHDSARFALFPGYRFLPTARNRLCWKLQRRVEKTLRRIVERRIEAVRDGQAISYGEDLLGRILAANSTSMADGSVLTTQDIMDECRTFFFAGHETTTNLLTWAMMLMAVYPDWQERARVEVLEVHGAEGVANPRTKLKILEMILNETLRLYPPVPQLISRTRVKDGDANHGVKTVGSILCVPPGVRLTILPGVVHRDKELWGNDADEFRPERFADGIPGACKATHGFMPFGFGPHICIGQTFAMLEAKLVLASVLQRFRFRLSNSYRHAPHLFATLRPQHGMPLLISIIQPILNDPLLDTEGCEDSY